MTRTIQKTKLEKAKERIEIEKKIIKDSILYYHYQSIKKELREENN
jgi:hypothetical protein